jgi:preprotein translocase subunit SecA
VIYAERKRVLNGEDMHEQARHMIDDVIEGYVRGATSEGYAEDWDLEQLWTSLKRLYPVSITIDDIVEESGGERNAIDQEFLVQQLKDDAQGAYDAREAELGEEATRELERQVLLAVIDRKWREHLYEMDYLQEGINLRAYAQRDPVVEYQREGFDMFNQMMEGIKEEAVGFLFNLEVQVEEQPSVTVDPSQAVPLPTVEESEHEAPVEVHAKGLGGGRRPQSLQYTAPAIDGVAGDGSPVIQEQSAPALGLGGDSPVPAGPAHGAANRGRQAARSGHQPGVQAQSSSGPSRNAPCYCGSGKKYKRCHGAPGATG